MNIILLDNILDNILDNYIFYIFSFYSNKWVIIINIIFTIIIIIIFIVNIILLYCYKNEKLNYCLM